MIPTCLPFHLPPSFKGDRRFSVAAPVCGTACLSPLDHKLTFLHSRYQHFIRFIIIIIYWKHFKSNSRTANCTWITINMLQIEYQQFSSFSWSDISDFKVRFVSVFLDSGCEIYGQSLTEGAPYKPNDSQCMECLCEGNATYCFPILCPTLTCRPEQVIVSEGSCCPTCIGEWKYFVFMKIKINAFINQNCDPFWKAL